jgi:hypothetical protein
LVKNYSLLKDIDFKELKYRGRLRPKSLRGNSFYECPRNIAEKASHYFKKASHPLKMYLKSLAILEKASNSLKKSSKIIEILIKAPHFQIKASIFLELFSKILVMFINSSYQIKKSLRFSENIFYKPLNLYKNLHFFKN